tara:strand:+ start:588 stop:1022 length:435 start_codon:yes stop_codon:yes gene_type:complete
MINKNEIQNQFNKFPVDKVELEKVQLSVVDDLSKAMGKLEKAAADEKEYYQAVKESNKIEKEIIKQISKQETARGKVQDKGYKLAKDGEELWSSVDDILQKANQAAKELGIKPDSITGYKKADSLASKIGDIDVRGDFIDNSYF